MKIKSRQDFLVVATVAVLVLAVLVNFILPPLQGWWADRQKQIKDLRQQISDGKVMIRRADAIRGDWKTMQDNALSAEAPEAEQQFLKALDGWERDSGAAIHSIMPQWKNDSTNYMTIDCRVEADGDLNSLSKFIYNIERGPMMVRLDSVELSTHDNTGQTMTLGLEINGLALLTSNKK